MYRILDPWQPAPVPVDLFHLIDAAERPARRRSRLAGRHTVALVLSCQQVEMCANLLVKVGVEPTSPQERHHTREEDADGGHQSARSATIGSTRVARRAGMNDANRDTPTRSIDTTA